MRTRILSVRGRTTLTPSLPFRVDARKVDVANTSTKPSTASVRVSVQRRPSRSEGEALDDGVCGGRGRGREVVDEGEDGRRRQTS